MKLFDIIKKIGGAVLTDVIPGGNAILDVVNLILPKDKQLPKNATGHDIASACAHLSGSERASLMEKEFDVQITEIKEGNETLREMLKRDAENPHSTRPHIALGSFYVLSSVTLLMVGIFAYGVYTKDEKVIDAVTAGWPLVIALTGTFTTVLLQYFGHLKTEHKNKMDAANGSTSPSGVAGLITSFINRTK